MNKEINALIQKMVNKYVSDTLIDIFSEKQNIYLAARGNGKSESEKEFKNRMIKQKTKDDILKEFKKHVDLDDKKICSLIVDVAKKRKNKL